MSYIIDRRLNSKDKNAVNRQRFLRRYRAHIKRAVSDAVSKRSITDIEKGEDISIPKKSIHEPQIGHGSGGKRNVILPGNDKFIVGDRVKRPEGGGGAGGGGNASDSGEGMDNFVFQISQEEFLHYLFEDLELPNLVKRKLAGTDSFKMTRAGFSEVGNPNQINIPRTMRSAHARRIALSGMMRKKRRRLEEELAELPDDDSEKGRARREELQLQISGLKRRMHAIPFIDDFDLKFNLHVKTPLPVSKAVMFCIMDVSGSMDQNTKDIAKRFFILLYLFLQRNYEKTDVVFIRHHTSAKEVDEEEFFYSRETGGTVVSSALSLMMDIIKDRYPPDEWNIYGAQASDGDNWHDDSPRCYNLLKQQILPSCQYFCYVEITERDSQELWVNYERLRESHGPSFAMQKLRDQSEIYPVFKELFQRKIQ